MKIPRYKNESGTTVSSGRSLTTGTQTGGAIASLGVTAINKVSEYIIFQCFTEKSENIKYNVPNIVYI